MTHQQDRAFNGVILFIHDLSSAWFHFDQRRADLQVTFRKFYAEAVGELRQSFRTALEEHLFRLLTLDNDDDPPPTPAAPGAQAPDDYDEHLRATLSEKACLDRHECPECGAHIVGRLDPRQVGAKPFPGDWYNYRCGCGFACDRIEGPVGEWPRPSAPTGSSTCPPSCVFCPQPHPDDRRPAPYAAAPECSSPCGRCHCPIPFSPHDPPCCGPVGTSCCALADASRRASRP